MSLVLALALALPQSAADVSSGELSTAFELVKRESLVPVADDHILAEAVRGMRLTAGIRPEDAPEAEVKDVPALLVYFAAVRERTRGRVDERRLVESAVNGMAKTSSALGGYFDMEADHALRARGAAGIGLSAKIDGGVPVVVSTIADSPSAAVLRDGDRITEIDGESVRGIEIDTFIARLRGAPGSPIALTVARGDAAPQTLALRRENIVNHPVRWRAEGGVGVIAISALGVDSVTEAKRAIVALRSRPRAPTGYILDLRGNQGGLLASAAELADMFLAKGPIGMQRGRAPSDVQSYAARKGDAIEGAPLIVLTDRETASGAEIVAAALQDNHRARIIGQKSHGMAMIQTVLPLGSRAAIRLTTSQYFRGSGAAIQGVGVTPDIETAVPEGGGDETLKTALGLLAASAS